MASLTPHHRSEEVTGQAMQEGLVNGAMVMVPCLAGLFLAMKNPSFRKVCNIELSLWSCTECFVWCFASSHHFWGISYNFVFLLL